MRLVLGILVTVAAGIAAAPAVAQRDNRVLEQCKDENLRECLKRLKQEQKSQSSPKKKQEPKQGDSSPRAPKPKPQPQLEQRSGMQALGQKLLEKRRQEAAEQERRRASQRQEAEEAEQPLPQQPPPAMRQQPGAQPLSSSVSAGFEVIGFEQTVSATQAPYTHPFNVDGRGLDAVSEIRWSWQGPTSGSSVWKPGDRNWSRFAPSDDGRSAVVRPVLIAGNDPAGTYRWTVTLVGGGRQVTRAFNVSYAPPVRPTQAARPRINAAGLISPVSYSRISAFYFDAGYPISYGRQHLGVDLPANERADVYSPVSGVIQINKTGASDVNQAFLVIRAGDGTEHVLGHIESSLSRNARVLAGEKIGRVRGWPGEPNRSHVHWGMNHSNAGPHSDVWGWGRAPVTATEGDAEARGWINLNSIVAGASAPAQSRPPPTPPTGSTALEVNGFEQTLSVSAAPHSQLFRLTGSGLQHVEEIRWSWSGPNDGNSVWRRGDRNWGLFVPAANGRSATIRPVVLAQGDPPGMYRWTVAFVASGQKATSAFQVYYEPPTFSAPPPPPPTVRAPSSPPGNPSPGRASAPGSTTSSTSVRLSWDSIPGATEYDFGVRDLTTDRLVIDRRTSGTSYTANLDPGRSYRWNVRACNNAGCSSFTQPLYFTTPGGASSSSPSAKPSAPATPRDPSPGGTASPGPITSSAMVRLSWRSASSATGYDLGVRDLYSNQLVVDQFITGTSLIVYLNRGRQYRWNVRACNSAGCSSFTTPVHFQTPD